MSELTIESLERAWDNVAEGGFLVFEPVPFEVRITKSRTGAKGLDFLLSADEEMEISSCEGFSAEIKGVDGQTVLSLVGTEANGTNVFETLQLIFCVFARACAESAALRPVIVWRLSDSASSLGRISCAQKQ